jgi:hypothetical protein
MEDLSYLNSPEAKAQSSYWDNVYADRKGYSKLCKEPCDPKQCPDAPRYCYTNRDEVRARELKNIDVDHEAHTRKKKSHKEE